ncbi:MAG: hypothetical protein ACOY3I_03945 [Verrucomicrobiota bacterium]
MKACHQQRILHIGGKTLVKHGEFALLPHFLESTNYLELGVHRLFADDIPTIAWQLKTCLQKIGKAGTMLVIHAPHGGHGFNPCERNSVQSSLLLAEAFKFARHLRAPIIVMHPGFVQLTAQETSPGCANSV